MKKIISILLITVIAFTLCACGGKKSVELTADNINDYIQFDGEFTNGKYTKSIVNYAEAILEFQAYPVAVGKFENVEITLVATSNDHTFTYMNDLGNYWHLTNEDHDTKEIEFTFRLGVDGNFSKNYSVICRNNTGVLSGASEFKVVSVSGTFTPQ